jgi:hypothetical protein
MNRVAWATGRIRRCLALRRALIRASNAGLARVLGLCRWNLVASGRLQGAINEAVLNRRKLTLRAVWRVALHVLHANLGSALVRWRIATVARSLATVAELRSVEASRIAARLVPP